jgi:hypothetical protein
MRWFLFPLVLATACGGQTGSDSGASSGGSSTGGASTGGASTGGASTGGASTGGASTGGNGGGSCEPVDPGTPCSALGESTCLVAHPRCVPLYDDHCCPACDPTGACADCIDLRFIGCTELEMSNCVPGTIGPCGMTPSWACSGGSATCPANGPCNSVAGCIEAKPADCPTSGCATECHAMTKYTCHQPCVSETPAPCTKGLAEASPDGYTGFCMREQVCASPTTDGCPKEAPPNGSACGADGMTCPYGTCASCTCTNGAWQCTNPPC